MSLHEHLRDLVAHQGPTVADTAETFRAALDDFLTEDEATTGELNLLVDAVRLGAVVRLRSILANGGSPQAAISEAGDGFARDRGTDDLPRCRWAVAVVGYALGLVEAADVPPTGPQSIPVTQATGPASSSAAASLGAARATGPRHGSHTTDLPQHRGHGAWAGADRTRPAAPPWRPPGAGGRPGDRDRGRCGVRRDVARVPGRRRPEPVGRRHHRRAVGWRYVRSRHRGHRRAR